MRVFAEAHRSRMRLCRFPMAAVTPKKPQRHIMDLIIPATCRRPRESQLPANSELRPVLRLLSSSLLALSPRPLPSLPHSTFVVVSSSPRRFVQHRIAPVPGFVVAGIISFPRTSAPSELPILT